MAWFRCEDEDKGNKFWMSQEQRVRRICRKERETIEHMMKECDKLKERKESRKEILTEDGRVDEGSITGEEKDGLGSIMIVCL